MRRRKRRCEGMTLIEIMVVVIIMSLIAGAVAINVMKNLEQARIHDTKTRARTIQTAAIAYMMQEAPGACPRVNDLESQLDPTTKRTDAWGNEFAITCDEGEVVHAMSPGPDGNPGTEDDLGF